jgi:hypothetical protein
MTSSYLPVGLKSPVITPHYYPEQEVPKKFGMDGSTLQYIPIKLVEPQAY